MSWCCRRFLDNAFSGIVGHVDSAFIITEPSHTSTSFSFVTEFKCGPKNDFPVFKRQFGSNANHFCLSLN